MNEIANSKNETLSKRKFLLTFLCVLTFISSGFFVIASLAGIFSSSWIAHAMEEFAPGYGTLGGSLLLILSFVCLIIFGLSLWGAILMFYQRKGGYIMYVIPNGLLLVVNIIAIFSARNPYLIIYLSVSVAFIILYATQVKNMK